MTCLRALRAYVPRDSYRRALTCLDVPWGALTCLLTFPLTYLSTCLLTCLLIEKSKVWFLGKRWIISTNESIPCVNHMQLTSHSPVLWASLVPRRTLQYSKLDRYVWKGNPRRPNIRPFVLSRRLQVVLETNNHQWWMTCSLQILAVQSPIVRKFFGKNWLRSNA